MSDEKLIASYFKFTVAGNKLYIFCTNLKIPINLSNFLLLFQVRIHSVVEFEEF